MGFLLSTTSSFMFTWKLWGALCDERGGREGAERKGVRDGSQACRDSQKGPCTSQPKERERERRQERTCERVREKEEGRRQKTGHCTHLWERIAEHAEWRRAEERTGPVSQRWGFEGVKLCCADVTGEEEADSGVLYGKEPFWTRSFWMRKTGLGKRQTNVKLRKTWLVSLLWKGTEPQQLLNCLQLQFFVVIFRQ